MKASSVLVYFDTEQFFFLPFLCIDVHWRTFKLIKKNQNGILFHYINCTVGWKYDVKELLFAEWLDELHKCLEASDLCNYTIIKNAFVFEWLGLPEQPCWSAEHCFCNVLTCCSTDVSFGIAGIVSLFQTPDSYILLSGWLWVIN